jgi:diacylglycerol kinase (ATP)
MRVAAILGLHSSTRHLQPFARVSDAHWQLGLPTHASDADAILIFGGDGTVHRHLPQLVQLQLPVLVVPHGSGNDFARALSLGRVDDALAAWRQFATGRRAGDDHREDPGEDVDDKNVRRIDLGVISAVAPPDDTEAARAPRGRYFCCVGGVGLDVEVARRANQLPRALRRRGGYLFSLFPALLGFQPLAVKVEVSRGDSSSGLDTCHDGPAMVVAFANTLSYGGGIVIAPRAKLDDGKLEVCVVGAMAKARLLRLFPSVYSGRHLNLPEVKYFQADRLRIETEKPSEVYADGEYVCLTPVEVTVEPAALKVIVPLSRRA